MILFGCFIYFAFQIPVYAASAGISVSSSSVYVGDGFTVYASVNSTAAWNVHVSASGPVSGCTINEVGDSGDLSEVNRNFSATCNATGEGTISLVLSGDITNGLGETQNIAGTANVFVSQRPAPSPSPSPQNPSPSPSPSSGNNNNNNNDNNEKKGEEKSSNNSLKVIKVEGYELTKVDDTHYTLNVRNSVDRIVIQVEREDTNAKIVGDGTRTLKIGENKLELVVTAENGSTKTYYLTVNRRDTSYKLKQLEEAIRDTDTGPVEIVLEKDDVLTSKDLEMMKKSKKTFQLTYYDKDNVGLYTWMFNGSNIDTTREIDTTIYFTLKDREDFDEAMEFKSGVILNFAHSGVLPNGTRIKMYVGDQYSDGESLSLYLYDAELKKRVPYADGVEVVDGYVYIDLEEGGVFFLTKASFGEKKGFNIFIPICIVEGFIILMLLFLGRKKKTEKEEKEEVVEEKKPETTEEKPVAETTPETTPETVPVTTAEPAPAPTPVTNPAMAVETTPETSAPEVLAPETTPATEAVQLASAPETLPKPIMASAPETLPAAVPDMPTVVPNTQAQKAPEVPATNPILVAVPIKPSGNVPEPRVY